MHVPERSAVEQAAKVAAEWLQRDDHTDDDIAEMAYRMLQAAHPDTGAVSADREQFYNEAAALRASATGDLIREERQRRRIRELEDAIRDHKDATMDGDPHADNTLWGMVP